MPYEFEFATPEDHFVTRYVRYAARRTDASWDFHEAAAFWLLANATPGVRATLSAFAGGLPTNLYLLFLGPSTASRKSTAIDIARDVLNAAIPGAAMPDKITPEGFIEQLAVRSGRAAGWALDEFTSLLRELHKRHMADLLELLLTVYSGRNYEYRRHSKRVKGGGTVEDADRVERPHLSIIGGTTPSVFRSLTVDHLESGLLPRFAVVAPTTKPERNPFYGMEGVDIAQERSEMVSWLRRISEWSMQGPEVRFERGALVVIDAYSLELEELAAEKPEDPRTIMRQRLAPMGLKLAMLIAAGHRLAQATPAEGGRPWENGRPVLLVTGDDAEAAVKILRRWQRYAEEFAARVEENAFEEKLQRVLRMVKERGTVKRRFVAINTKVEKDVLDRIIDTLIDRGLIKLVQEAPAGGMVLVYTGDEQDAAEAS